MRGKLGVCVGRGVGGRGGGNEKDWNGSEGDVDVISERETEGRGMTGFKGW